MATKTTSQKNTAAVALGLLGGLNGGLARTASMTQAQRKIILLQGK
jgi:prolyl oligopeptidase PreP (S9A serine peptidase family)